MLWIVSEKRGANENKSIFRPGAIIIIHKMHICRNRKLCHRARAILIYFEFYHKSWVERLNFQIHPRKPFIFRLPRRFFCFSNFTWTLLRPRDQILNETCWNFRFRLTTAQAHSSNCYAHKFIFCGEAFQWIKRYILCLVASPTILGVWELLICIQCVVAEFKIATFSRIQRKIVDLTNARHLCFPFQIFLASQAGHTTNNVINLNWKADCTISS